MSDAPAVTPTITSETMPLIGKVSIGPALGGTVTCTSVPVTGTPPTTPVGQLDFSDPAQSGHIPTLM